MQPDPSQVKAQIFVAVASALTNKWPAHNTHDHEIIARTTVNLSDKLFEAYLDKSKFKEQKEE